MIYLIFLIIDFFLLYILSRLITRAIARLLHGSTGSIHFTVQILFFILFPGTLLHELAHLAMAHMLGVPAFSMELFPKLHKQTLRLGSVSIAKTDFVRRALIGLAPFFVGSIVLALCLWARFFFQLTLPWQTVLVGFLLFEVSNTMFPSKKDLEGIWIFFLVVFAFGFGLAWLIGRETLVGIVATSHYLQTGVFYLTTVLFVDLGIFLFLKVLLHMQARLQRR